MVAVNTPRDRGREGLRRPEEVTCGMVSTCTISLHVCTIDLINEVLPEPNLLKQSAGVIFSESVATYREHQLEEP